MDRRSFKKDVTDPPGQCARLLVLALVMLAALIGSPDKARAICSTLCEVEPNTLQEQILKAYIKNKHRQTRDSVNRHTDDAFESHEKWMFEVYFKRHILAAMMRMTDQLSAVAMQQMQIVGTFLDSKHQLETQRLYQQLAAQAHKDYHPSEGLCTIGTAARNLAGADRDGDMTALILARRSSGRQLMNANSSGAEGATAERRSRTAQFRKTYCDPNDSNKGLTGVCEAGVPPSRKNKDVDFARTLWQPLTLNANFNDTAGTDDEADLIALQTNLYGNDIFDEPMAATSLRFDPANPDRSRRRIEAYMNMRSIVAKRGVAENSFQSIAAMKVSGSPSSTAQYLQAAVRELNPAFPPAEAAQMIGANPSYDAQMEILTKKTIETPQFFTDLYDKPANVARKGVALDAVMLIQDRDEYKSMLRMESMLSVLLELKLQNEQTEMQNRLDPLVEQ